MRHPYTQGLFRSIPLPGADKNSRPLIAIPGQLPLPHERPKGCNFGPRCHHFVEGLCNAAEIPMIPVEGHDRPFQPLRALQRDRLERRCRKARKEKQEPVKPGAPVLKIDDLKKYYKVAANEIFGGGEGRVGQGQRDDQLRGARDPRRWRSSANPAAASRRWPRCCSAWRRRRSGTVTLGNKDIQSTGDRDARRRRPCRRSRWCSRTRSTR